MRARPVVLIASPSLDALSGVTTHALSLLGSSLQASFDLVHFQVGSEGRAETPAQAALRLLASPFVLAWAIVRHGAAIVHLNTSLNGKAFWRDSLYAAVAKLCGARVVLQKHGGTLGEFCARYPKLAVRGALKLADAVAVLSRAELREYAAFLPGKDIVLLPNGIDPAPFRKRSGAEASVAAPLRLLYLGRLAPGKGIDESLEAMALLRGRPAGAILTLAGSGPEEERLRGRVAELGLEPSVRFAGPAFGEEKLRLLAQAEVLLLPSYSEGLPYSLLEAMAAGAVPVVTPVGAIPDVVEEGVHGLFVPVGDAQALAQAISALEADRSRLARMAAAARRRVANAYSIDRLAAAALALYATLAPGRSPRPIL